MNLTFKQNKGWEEKPDERITNIQPVLCGRQLNIIKKYPINRTNDENVHAFIINSLLQLKILII